MEYSGFEVSSAFKHYLYLCNWILSYINLLGNSVILLNYLINSGKVILLINFKNIYLTNFKIINN